MADWPQFPCGRPGPHRREPAAISVATLIRAEPTMLAEIAKLEAHEKELSTPSALRGLIEPGADVAHRWQAIPISTRRESPACCSPPS